MSSLTRMALPLAVNSSLYKTGLRLREAVHILRLQSSRTNLGTKAYCISPYKSGTTYLSGLFRGNCAHEPMHFATLRRLDDDEFMRRRHFALDLDLESSGFLAGHLGQLRSYAPEVPVLYLVRHPFSWVRSAIRYFSTLSERVSYNYVLREYFDGVSRYPIDEWRSLGRSQRVEIIQRLVEYYLVVLEEGLDDPRTLYVLLEEVDRDLESIARFVGLQPVEATDVWRRPGRSALPVEVTDYVSFASYRYRWLRIMNKVAESSGL